MNEKNKQKSSSFSNPFISTAINILSLSSRLEDFMSADVKKYNLTLPQFNVLYVLASHHNQSIPLNKLTEKMIDKSSNTSRLIDKLVEKKLVDKQSINDDRRVVHISVSEKGWVLINQVSEQLELNLGINMDTSRRNDIKKLIEELKIILREE